MIRWRGIRAVRVALLAQRKQRGVDLGLGSMPVTKVCCFDPGHARGSSQLEIGGEHRSQVRCVMCARRIGKPMLEPRRVGRVAGNPEQNDVQRLTLRKARIGEPSADRRRFQARLGQPQCGVRRGRALRVGHFGE